VRAACRPLAPRLTVSRRYVLEQILSGEMTEVVVERIHEYLSTIGENVKAGRTPLDEFIIHKRLGKNPEEYPDAKSQPHVQVALRLKARGSSARAGDVISYVFCSDVAGAEQPAAKTAQAERAKHPDEIRRANGELKIGACVAVAQGTNADEAQTSSTTCPTKSCRPSNVCVNRSKAPTALGWLNALVRHFLH
jgi:hypothetical protein